MGSRFDSVCKVGTSLYSLRDNDRFSRSPTEGTVSGVPMPVFKSVNPLVLPFEIVALRICKLMDSHLRK